MLLKEQLLIGSLIPENFIQFINHKLRPNLNLFKVLNV